MLASLDEHHERLSTVIDETGRQLNRRSRIVDEHRQDLVPGRIRAFTVTGGGPSAGWLGLRVRHAGIAWFRQGAVRVGSLRMLPRSGVW